MKKRIVSALLAGFLLVSATACGKQTAADAAQPVADPTQAYLDTVDVDYAYDLALKLEDIRSNETLGYRTAGSDAELATGICSRRKWSASDCKTSRRMRSRWIRRIRCLA